MNLEAGTTETTSHATRTLHVSWTRIRFQRWPCLKRSQHRDAIGHSGISAGCAESFILGTIA